MYSKEMNNSTTPPNNNSPGHSRGQKWGFKVRLTLWFIGILIIGYVLMMVITGIRTLFAGNERAEELKGLLAEAKTVFNEASGTFGALDTTYESLDGEYQTVFESADAISNNLTEVDTIANGITDEFQSVAQTFSQIEEAYTGVIDQYNEACEVAGLAYIQTGALSDGIPITVILYPYGGTRETAVSILPIHVSPETDALVYTDANNYIDSRLPTPDETQSADIRPILHAYDKDGFITTRDTDGNPRYKKLTIRDAIVDNTVEVVELEVEVLGSDRVEHFIMNSQLSQRVEETSDWIKYGVQVESVDPDSTYAFEVTGGGQLQLKRLTEDELALIHDGKNIPSYKPATLSDLTQIQGQTFDSITPSIQRVLELNRQKDDAMSQAAASRASIISSNLVRKELAQTHDDLVTKFEAFSVDRLVPEKDFLDSYCTVM